MSIGPEELAAVERVMAYAKEHVFDMTSRPYPPPPGDNPQHVVMFGPLRAVYTLTLAPCHFREGRTHLYHHLSVSVMGKLPMPFMVASVAEAFGIDFEDPDTVVGKQTLAEGDPNDCIVLLAEAQEPDHEH